MGIWIVLAGFVALVAQVLLLRELAVTFYGNELYFSAALASWVLLTAIGSGLLGNWGDRLREPRRVFFLALAATGVLLPLTVLLVRAAPLLFLLHLSGNA